MNSIPKVQLICSSLAQHLHQLYSGFGELYHQGTIDLVISRDHDFHGGKNGPCLLKALVNGSIRIVYDVKDSATFFDKIEPSEYDFCFKRSCGLADEQPPGFVPVLPFGLNFCVMTPHSVAKRMWSWPATWRERFNFLFRMSPLLSALARVSVSAYTGAARRYEQLPRLNSDPRVIFMTRLWDPGRAKTEQSRAERVQQNDMRVNCVKVLKKEFGKRFIGGLERDAFALAYAPDCVLQNRRDYWKGSYLKLLANADIGVTTTGLAGSTGWKFAEYVAGAKAIVSEPLGHRLPGDFAVGRNYLPFTTPEECAAQVDALLTQQIGRASCRERV